MYLAMCADAGILIAALFWLLFLIALVGTPIIFALVTFLKWAGARQKRLASNER